MPAKPAAGSGALFALPREPRDPREDEFDPGHTMSPPRPADGDETGPASAAALSFDDGATPAAPAKGTTHIRPSDVYYEGEADADYGRLLARIYVEGFSSPRGKADVYTRMQGRFHRAV